MSQERRYSIWGRDDERTGAGRTGVVPVRETIREIWAIDLGHMSSVLDH
jgi:hypothetical protein